MKYAYHTATQTLMGDLHTPVGTYLKVRDIYPQSALMESSDYHSGENSRSFIAMQPIGSVSISHGKATIKLPNETEFYRDINQEYRSEHAINEFLDHFSVTGDNANYCGLYGYTERKFHQGLSQAYNQRTSFAYPVILR